MRLTETRVPAKAVQDYKYVVKVSQQPLDYFIASGKRAHDRVILETALEKAGKTKDKYKCLAPSDSPAANAGPETRSIQDPLTYNRMKLEAVAMGLSWEDGRC